MFPAFKPGDRLQLDGNVGELQRGDIVSYKVSFRGEPPQQMVHRIVGLPGERLEPAQDGGVLVNGEQLVEDYLAAGMTTQLREPVEVPADHVFLMGDNRERSSDSRVTGPIRRADIVAKLTKVDPAKNDEDCGVTPAAPEAPPLTFNDHDPPALQLLTLPVVIEKSADRGITADNLETVRTEVRDYADRLEALLRDAGSPERNAAHAALRDAVIPALRSLTAAPSPHEWTAQSQALDAAMTHYLQAIEEDVRGD